jgi:replicative DNA helicase
MPKQQQDVALERGLPAAPDIERMVLGAILRDDSQHVTVTALLDPSDLFLESNRRIFTRMADIASRGERIDRVTIIQELKRNRELESVGGISAIVSLDEGLPELVNLESYCNIVREKARLRRIIHSAALVTERALSEESSHDIASEAARDLVELADRKDSSGAQLAYSIIEQDPGAFFENTVEQNTGLKTGLTKLDDMTGGLQKQDLIVIAARPGVGKSALLMNIAAHIAIREGGKVGIWSLEMTKRALLTRLICGEARIDLRKFRAGYLSSQERDQYRVAAHALRGVGLAIEDRKSINIVEVHAAARKMKAKHGLDLIGIDYLQLLNQHTKTDNQARAIGDITKYIKTAICPDLDVPVLLLSQINRENEKRKGDHRPQLSDLKSSGSIEEDADIVAFCYRPEYYDKNRADIAGLGELILEKHRSGPTGTIKLVFLKEYTKWENRVGERDDQQSLEGS